MGRCWTCMPIIMPLLSWACALVTALGLGKVFAVLHMRHFTRPNATAAATTTKGIGGSRTAQPDSGGAGGYVVTAGRPDLASLLAAYAAAAEGALDVYVCGPQSLQASTIATFEAQVRPRSMAASVHTLAYKIGG